MRSVRRFYFADGHCELREPLHDVRDGDRPPRYYKIIKLEPMTLLSDADMFPRMPNGRIHMFELRWYGYAPNFIGPHRNEDYHEE